MLRLFCIMSMIFLVSCSSSRKHKNINVPDGEPEWLYSASAGCQGNEICASGEGTNLSEADAHAKKALAGIFETKINAQFRVSKHSFTDTEVSELKETVQDEVNQHIDMIVKGVEIKNRFKKDDLYFAQASLNKTKSMQILRQELTKIDDEMSHYFNLKNRLYIKKLNFLFNKREALSEKLSVIDTAGAPRRITFNQINNLKFSSTGGSSLHVQTSGEVPSVLLKKIEEVFTEVGYKLTPKEKSDYEININFKESEEYLNVKGFKKYTFEINLEAKKQGGKQVGGYIITKISNGRTKNDAFLKVRRIIISDLQQNIEKLNLN